VFAPDDQLPPEPPPGRWGAPEQYDPPPPRPVPPEPDDGGGDEPPRGAQVEYHDGRRPGRERRPLRRRRPPPDGELHYGESTRRRASALGLGGEAPSSEHWIDAGGRFGTAAHDPILGWYQPDSPTAELPIAEELARLKAAGVIVDDPRVGERPVGEPPVEGPRPAQPGPEPGTGNGHGYGNGAATIPPPPVLDAPPTVVPPPTGVAEPTSSELRAEDPIESPAAAKQAQKGSFMVAAGIILSRSAGLIREIAISNYLGATAAADAFKAALRIPNMLQNLLGEGVLSASFIPVYARMRAEGREEEAGKLAGAICGLLLLLSSVLVLIGVVFTEPITKLLVTGFSGDERFDLTVDLVRIMFPAMGLMPISAWCLGVLNSHRKFFLSYVAPVMWNAGQIIALVTVAIAGATSTELATALAWGVLIGSIGEVGIQLPSVLKVLGHLRLSVSTKVGGVRSVLSRFGPVVLGRGVVQIVGFVELWLAAFLATGAVSSLTYAQVLYLLPISVFGMSVAAAELPDLSKVEVHNPESRRVFRHRLEDGMSRILFYVAPTTTMFIVAGDVVVRLLLQRGKFSADDTQAIWYVIAAFSLGLPATTASRLLQNGLYALDDARTPARLAMIRVAMSSMVGLVVMFPLDRLTVINGTVQGWGDMLAWGPLPESVRTNPAGIPHLGMVGLALGAAASSWLEYRLLSQALAWRIGRSYLGGRWISPIAMGCIVMALLAFAAEMLVGTRHAIIAAAVILVPAGLAYLAVTYRLGVPEARALWDRVRGLLRRGSG
jgi:putative peptidoglycan lipid II flippase